MKKLIRLFALTVASTLFLAASAYWLYRNRYPKVTTIEVIPVAATTLEVQPVAPTILEPNTQSATSTTTELESQPATSTTTELENQPATSTTTELANQPPTSTTTVVETPPPTSTTEIETPSPTTQVEPKPTPTKPVEVKNQPVPTTEIKVETPPPTKITAANVERTLTELKAKKTKQEIIINLPENILFEFDKYHVRAQAKPTLTKINQVLSYYSKANIFIYGHTDSKGDDAYNEKLSQLRAAAVKYYLINVFKAQPTRLQTKGFGKTKPIAPNNNPDGSDNPNGREKNRRVEVVIKN